MERIEFQLQLNLRFGQLLAQLFHFAEISQSRKSFRGNFRRSLGPGESDAPSSIHEFRLNARNNGKRFGSVNNWPTNFLAILCIGFCNWNVLADVHGFPDIGRWFPFDFSYPRWEIITRAETLTKWKRSFHRARFKYARGARSIIILTVLSWEN